MPGRVRLDLFEYGILSNQLFRSIRTEHDVVFEIVHRGERIKKDLEIRPVLPGSKLHGSLNGQIATRRTTHHAYPLRIAPPVLGMLPHNLDCFLDIAQRGLKMAVRHSIFQDSQGDTDVIEPGSESGALLFYFQIVVSAPGAGDNHCSVRPKRRENPQFRFGNVVDTPRRRMSLLRNDAVVVRGSVRPNRDDDWGAHLGEGWKCDHCQQENN